MPDAAQQQRERMQRNREIALLRLRSSRAKLDMDALASSSPSSSFSAMDGHRHALPPGRTAINVADTSSAARGTCGKGMMGAEKDPLQTLAIQDFEYLVVIDFECTCNRHLDFSPREIIEFPSVLVSCRHLQLHDAFRTYVKPIYHPTLTDFCTQLTGIKQSQVDAGVSLAVALDMHDKWLTEKNVKKKKFAILTWKDWDCKVMLESECKLKGLSKPSYFDRWINLKIPFKWVFRGMKCNLKTAVEAAGLEWEGNAHCGLDDAKNTARLALELMRRGINLRITNISTSYDACRFSSLPPDARKRYLKDGVEPTIMCYCGVHSLKNMVNKPGPSYGQYFLSCGRGRLHDGSKCHFFQWVSSV